MPLLLSPRETTRLQKALRSRRRASSQRISSHTRTQYHPLLPQDQILLELHKIENALTRIASIRLTYPNCIPSSTLASLGIRLRTSARLTL